MAKNEDILKKLINKRPTPIRPYGFVDKRNKKLMIVIYSLIALIVIMVAVAIFKDEIKPPKPPVIPGKAEYNLGVSAYNNKNYYEAFEKFKLSWEQEYEPAKAILGFMYYNAEGTRKDCSTAKTYLEDTCNKGYKNSCNSLGIMYSKGDCVSKDNEKSKEYFNKSK